MLFFMEKGITFLEIGILYSTREIVIMIMEIPSGIISDAFGRRKTLLISFVIYILSFLMFYVSNNYALLLTAIILYAIADAARTGVHKAMIFHYLDIKKWGKYKIDYYGHTRSWSQSGSAISALIASLFVFFSGSYQIVFIISIIPYLADMLLIYSYPLYLDGEISVVSILDIKVRFKTVINAMIKTLKSLKYFRIQANLSLYTGFYKAIKDYIQPLTKYLAFSLPVFVYLNDQKKTAVIVGIVYSLMYILTAIASKYSGKFTSQFKNSQKPMNLTLVIGLIFGLVSGLSFVFELYYIAIVGFFAIMIVENLRKPVGIGLIADLSNNRSMATSLSITSQSKSIFAAILAPVIGWIADIYNPGTGIIVVSLSLIILIPIYWLNHKSN
jgi:MFS family permease